MVCVFDGGRSLGLRAAVGYEVVTILLLLIKVEVVHVALGGQRMIDHVNVRVLRWNLSLNHALSLVGIGSITGLPLLLRPLVPL